MMEAEHLE